MCVAEGNLWLVRLATFTLQPMEHTNHKFPAATATGIPCEVKSTVGFKAHCIVVAKLLGFKLGNRGELAPNIDST